jgi:hypothetical protein
MNTEKICTICGSGEVFCRTMCRHCYNQQTKTSKPPCTVCGGQNYHSLTGRSLCRKHYSLTLIEEHCRRRTFEQAARMNSDAVYPKWTYENPQGEAALSAMTEKSL